jgi:hypothetical protein
VSQLAVGLLIDHVATRVLVAACGAVTLTYSIIWRVITRRQDRHNLPEVVALEPD